MKRILIAAIALSLASPVAAEEDYIVTPDMIGSITMFIDDQAIDGCWTNSSKSLEYLRTRLSSVGFTIKEGIADWDEIEAVVEVRSKRLDGECFGSVYVAFRAFGEHDNGLFYSTTYAEYQHDFAGYDNANDITFKTVDKFMDIDITGVSPDPHP